MTMGVNNAIRFILREPLLATCGAWFLFNFYIFPTSVYITLYNYVYIYRPSRNQAQQSKIHPLTSMIQQSKPPLKFRSRISRHDDTRGISWYVTHSYPY
jgi:hypothetical protein